MRTFAALCSALVLASTVALAGGGSTYSILGLGDLRYFPGTRGAGMGYTGIGLPGVQVINSTAPATWARINRTRLEGGVFYEGFNSTDGERSRYLARADFSGALIAVPVSTDHGIVAVAGFIPYSSVNFNSYSTGGFLSATDTLDYTLNHVGSGGLGQAEVGLSYAPSQDLALGTSLNYIFGTIDNAVTMTPASTSYAGSHATQSTTIRGVVVDLGALYTGLGRIAPALAPLSLGVNITTRGVLTTSRQSTYEFGIDPVNTPTAMDTTTEQLDRMVVPFSYGVGMSYALSDRWIVAADYRQQFWAKAEFNGQSFDNIRNSSMVGVGIEHMPSRELNATFGARTSYRFGFVYNATYYKLNNQPINEWAVTGGLSMPISTETRLDLSAEYGRRGTTQFSLIKENVFRFNVSVSIGELWFVRGEDE